MGKLKSRPARKDPQLIRQGMTCSVADYLNLETNHLVEYVNGRLEVLAMPQTWHQFLVGFLYRALFAFVDENDSGEVAFAPLSLRGQSAVSRARRPLCKA